MNQVPMEGLVEEIAHALRAVEFVKFSIAEELAAKKLSGSWRQCVYPEGHDRAGSHPSSFRRFLEALTEEERAKKLALRTGDLEELIKLYEWGLGLGLDVQQMALLTQQGMKGLHRLHSTVSPEEARQRVWEALMEVQTYGKFHLPADRPEGKVSVVLRFKDEHDGSYSLKAVELWKDGTPYKNRFPEALRNWFSKRTRGAVEVED